MNQHDWRKSLLKTLEAVVLVGDLIVLVAHQLIAAFGVLLVLAIMVAVEQQRVEHGIALFDPQLASGASWGLVISNVVFEAMIYYLEYRAGYKQEPQTEFSLRLLGRRLKYLLGFGGDWQARTRSPALHFHTLSRVTTATILALALAGSMTDQLAAQEGTWLEGLVSVLTASSLKDMMTWAGGLLFAFAAVLGAQATSRFTAARAVEIHNKLRARKRGQPKSGSRKVHEIREIHENSRTTGAARVNIRAIAEQVHANGDANLSTEAMMERYQISQGSTSKVREYVKSMNGNGKETP